MHDQFQHLGGRGKRINIIFLSLGRWLSMSKTLTVFFRKPHSLLPITYD